MSSEAQNRLDGVNLFLQAAAQVALLSALVLFEKFAHRFSVVLLTEPGRRQVPEECLEVVPVACRLDLLEALEPKVREEPALLSITVVVKVRR